MKYLAVAVVAFALGVVAGLAIPPDAPHSRPEPVENLQSPPETKMPLVALEKLTPAELIEIIGIQQQETGLLRKLIETLKEKLNAYESIRPQRG